jgi:hypothetical protein
MATAVDIVIADGQASPVNHTFKVTDVKNDLVTYHDKASGVVAGFPRLTLGRRMPTADNRNLKVTSRVYLPVLETAATAASGFTPGPTLAYALSSNVDVVIPDRATLAERKDIYAYQKNLLAHAIFGPLIVDMDFPY